MKVRSEVYVKRKNVGYKVCLYLEDKLLWTKVYVKRASALKKAEELSKQHCVVVSDMTTWLLRGLR